MWRLEKCQQEDWVALHPPRPVKNLTQQTTCHVRTFIQGILKFIVLQITSSHCAVNQGNFFAFFIRHFTLLHKKHYLHYSLKYVISILYLHLRKTIFVISVWKYIYRSFALCNRSNHTHLSTWFQLVVVAVDFPNTHHGVVCFGKIFGSCKGSSAKCVFKNPSFTLPSKCRYFELCASDYGSLFTEPVLHNKYTKIVSVHLNCLIGMVLILSNLHCMLQSSIGSF